MSWLILVFVGAILLSFSALLQRTILKDEQSDSAAFSFAFQFIVALVAFGYALIVGFKFPPLTPLLVNIILMSLLYAVGDLLLFKAYQTVEAAEVGVIFSSRTVWTVLTAAIFLKETMTVYTVFGTILVVFGVVIVLWKKGTWKLSRGAWLTIAASLFFGLAFTNDAFILRSFDAATYTFIAFLLPSLLTPIIRPGSMKKLPWFFNRQRLAKLFITGIFYGGGVLAIFSAYRAGGNASQISPITQLSVIFTAVLAYIFLREKSNIFNKIVGALLVFAGVWFLR